MSALQQPKWDWDAHFPLMEELYHAGRSIPDIWKAIQCEGFTPCQRAVYDKFRSEGHSTKPNRRPRCVLLGSPQSATIISRSVSNGSSIQTCFLNTGKDGSTLSVDLNQQVVPAGLAASQGAQPTLHPIVIDNSHTSPKISQVRQLDGQQNLASTESPIYIINTERDVAANCLSSNPPDSTPQTCLSEPARHTSRKPEARTTTTRNLSRERRETLRSRQGEMVITNLVMLGLVEDSRPSRRRRQNQTAESASSSDGLKLKQTTDGVAPVVQRGQGSSGHHRSRGITKLHSLFKPKHRELGFGTPRRSLFNNNDSGYFSICSATSRTSTGSCSLPHPSPVTEFSGLYRAACNTLHEPAITQQFRNTDSCGHCGYSSIHNLAWSSRHLRLPVYISELALKHYYDVGAIDAAGNSALHYAAATGAEYFYIKALIDSGVPRYQINTAGQSFLHCLHLSDRSPSHSGTSLISVLKLVQPELAFGQRDNDGRTVLHSLAKGITEPDLRMQVFQYFTDSGFPPNVLDRFGRTAKDIISPAYNFGQTMVAAATINTINNTYDVYGNHTTMLGWELQEWEKENDQKTIGMAETNALYVDNKTRDTILHVLSRSTMNQNIILGKIKHVISEGLELNKHNLKGQHPLLSFIHNQNLRRMETGADMAKYLEAMLWKDAKHQSLNNINVDMKCRQGTTALYEVAIRAQSDSVRSLIEAGANVNSRSDDNENRTSILQATLDAREQAALRNNQTLQYKFEEVISHLEHAGAVREPTSLQERGCRLESATR